MTDLLSRIDTQQIFATIAQVIPVLVLALMVEAREAWFKTSAEHRRKPFLILVATA